MDLSVRELQLSDIPLLVDYWLGSSEEHLLAMGVDPKKVPTRPEFEDMLETQLALPIEEWNAYCIIWLLNGLPIGHCNTNPTTFGEEAKMHLHIWTKENRKLNLGTRLLTMTIPLLFKNLDLKRLYCEPYALNPAPNRTLARLGFEFVKEYFTSPGMITFEQQVNQWVVGRERFVG